MKVKKILVTGGPVHTYLDAIKIITNRFKGGRMFRLADQLRSHGYEVTYLTAKGYGFEADCVNQIFHDGFDDYMQKVLELAPQMDAVILGAAVANLIPLNPLTGKFPSHNYKPGDVIPIDFTIAPRIIDEVKKVAPNTHLFGFKLLKDVPHEELVKAAYEIVLEARATAVFANDASNLDQVCMVTKERGEHLMDRSKIEDTIEAMLADEYYSTLLLGRHEFNARLNAMLEKCAPRFTHVEGGYIFGTVAMRDPANFSDGGAFKTTGRGKKEDTKVDVLRVDHETREVTATGKASLNAPLLHRIFETNKDVRYIIHFHEQVPGLPTFSYAPPGTVRDSMRSINTSFNIKGHGCFLLITNGKILGMDMTLDEFLETPNGS